VLVSSMLLAKLHKLRLYKHVARFKIVFLNILEVNFAI